MIRLAFASAMYPLLLLGAVYGTWLAAWATLGHRPRPMIDDPKSISAAVDVLYDAAGVMMIGFAPAAAIFFGNLGIFLIDRIRRRRRVQRAHAAAAAVGVCLWVGGFIFLRQDPARILYWFMD